VYASQTLFAQGSQQPQTVSPAPAEQTPNDAQAKAAAEKAAADKAAAVKAATDKAAADQTAFEAAKAYTTTLLKSSDLARKYYLLQAVRNKKKPPSLAPSLPGISVTPLGSVVAKDVITTAEADQLYQPFGAVFDLLGSFSDAGSGAYPSAQSGIQTELLGRVEWESEHYGYQNLAKDNLDVGYVPKLDFSFGGSVGLYPALVIENLSSTTTTIAQPLARPMFQDAFQWEIGPRLNYPLFAHGEATIFANLGQNFLINQVTSFKQGDNTVTATPVSNGVGRTAAFGEVGLEAKILSSTIWLAHDNKYDNLRPLFLIATGVKKDNRLTGSGDLGGYDHAQDRLFFRFFINLTSIVAYNDQVKKAAPGSLRFGIDMERGLFSQRIPTATRFFVSADFNIMQVFKPSSQGQ
jgi:hypothetical protein